MMEQIKHSEQFLRKRKFLTLLPLITLPFVVGFFLALGGGKGNPKKQGEKILGLNSKVPDAHFKSGREKDKMDLYEEAKKDSLKFKRLANDSALRHVFEQSAAEYHLKNISSDPNEEKLVEQLSQLKKVMSERPVSYKKPTPDYNSSAEKIDRYLQSVSAKNSEPDPELNKLGTMLDKIMLIQHPESVQDSMKKLAEKNKPAAFPVTASVAEDNISLLGDPGKNEPSNANAFYGLSDEPGTDTLRQHAILAVIPENETLVSGATVKLRLLSDIVINAIRIPKNEFVFGTAFLSNERLRITINSIRYQDNILPVSLTVYDMDGMAGIYIPGSINRDVSKESADDAISTIGLMPVDQSVSAQAAVAGIQAAKTLATRKIKLIRVNIRSGYQVLLKDNNQKN